MAALFRETGSRLELVIHAAAQPSHDWSALDPATDFTVNANGTLNLLQATPARAPEATFVFISTNKVYGDRPNALPLIEFETRLELPPEHEYYAGIPTSMSIDRSLHSLFGVSKASADLLVQEYGRYFGIPTVCFRAGCVTGPEPRGRRGARVPVVPHALRADGDAVHRLRARRQAGAGQPACAGSRPRNLASTPRRASQPSTTSAAGGTRIARSSRRSPRCEGIAERRLEHTYSLEPRIGDHRWWISDVSEFRRDYPEWEPEYGIDEILQETYDSNVEAWASAAL